MKSIKQIVFIIINILTHIVTFILLLLNESANWFLNQFGLVEFSTVVYQLSSPMRGVGKEILFDYLLKCFLLVVIQMVLFEAIVYIIGKILPEKRKLFIRKIVIMTVLIFLILLVYTKATTIGIPQYIDDMKNASTVFEEKYVDPSTIDILFQEQKRNLLLIYMESMETTYASAENGGGKSINYIPELTNLARNNISFSNDDNFGGAGKLSGTGWTMGGLLGSSTGVPYKLPIEGNSAGEYEEFLPGITSLGDLLEEQGYNNYFMCGSDASFGGRRLFYEQHGNYQIIDYNIAKEEKFIPEDYYEFWGMEDKKLYEFAKEKLTEIGGNEAPFNFTMLTVDTHHPDGYLCELCGDEYADKYANVISCASKQVYNFLEWVKTQDWYENTTIVILGDHLSMNNDFWYDIDDYDRKIYNCFINVPDEVEPINIKDRDFCVLDFFPTTLAAMGIKIEGNRLGLGTNLFSKEESLIELWEGGSDAFNLEVSRYSNYYYREFIVDEGKN